MRRRQWIRWPRGGGARILALWQALLHESPRPDVVRGWSRWCWLLAELGRGNYIDRTVQVRCTGPLANRLTLGEAVALDRGTILWMGRENSLEGRIHLGSRCYIGPNVYLGSLHRLTIGEDTLVGAGAYMITANHRYENAHSPIADQGYVGGDIHIGKRVWIGAHAILLPGVTVGDQAVVAAAAVVRQDIPAGEVWGGVPARFLKASFPQGSMESKEPAGCD